MFYERKCDSNVAGHVGFELHYAAVILKLSI